ncbi:MAG: hypothetical protein ACRYHQ_10380, partial [Janthinobacterium lividum]
MSIAAPQTLMAFVFRSRPCAKISKPPQKAITRAVTSTKVGTCSDKAQSSVMGVPLNTKRLTALRQYLRSTINLTTP